jgi:hypothetical protein
MIVADLGGAPPSVTSVLLICLGFTVILLQCCAIFCTPHPGLDSCRRDPSILYITPRVWLMVVPDLGGTPLGVAAGPSIWLGFASYRCNVVLIDLPFPI